MKQNLANIFLFAAVVFFAGCAPKIQKPLPVCPGSASLSQALEIINAKNAAPFKVSNGDCQWIEKINGDVKNKESFAVKLWVSPPFNIRMQGDIAFNPAGLSLGSNQKEFWLSLKPKEVSTYWWGSWSQQDSLNGLALSPAMLMDAFGIIDTSDTSAWSLGHGGAFDILTQTLSNSRLKKVYVNNCTQKIVKIIYLDSTGSQTAKVELDKYINVTGGDFEIPSFIRLTSTTAEGAEEMFTIKINSAAQADFSELQEKKLFARPAPRGFENIYEVTHGAFIKQQ